MNEKTGRHNRLFAVVAVGYSFLAVAFVVAAYSAAPLSNTGVIGMSIASLVFAGFCVLFLISHRERQTGNGANAVNSS